MRTWLLIEGLASFGAMLMRFTFIICIFLSYLKSERRLLVCRIATAIDSAITLFWSVYGAILLTTPEFKTASSENGSPKSLMLVVVSINLLYLITSFLIIVIATYK